jgi:hypothetical protein
MFTRVAYDEFTIRTSNASQTLSNCIHQGSQTRDFWVMHRQKADIYHHASSLLLSLAVNE